ncbi:MAG: hypothetical protein ACRDO0_11370 [Nocardioidaceae bacterium]
MDFVLDVLVFLHLLGMASLFGGAFVQIRSPQRVVNNAMLHGILTQIVTGLLIVGILESGTEPVNHPKIGVKFALAVIIGVFVIVNRKKPSIPNGLYFGLLGLTVATVGVAVFWN